MFICNFTPAPRSLCRVGVFIPGEHRAVLNSDA
ncbi:MAG TPA: hypothetical protein DHW45_13225 [Candidatus Latescibacteria bacterium]|nr:hypothetical protein [Candidatus Latescibacterota bacterium]